eukprot:1043150-Amphidinium_carterae.2
MILGCHFDNLGDEFMVMLRNLLDFSGQSSYQGLVRYKAPQVAQTQIGRIIYRTRIEKLRAL